MVILVVRLGLAPGGPHAQAMAAAVGSVEGSRTGKTLTKWLPTQRLLALLLLGILA